MTKTIKIISDDHRSHAAVEAALKAANGGATAHTYTRAGAAMSAVSGSRLPNAYKYTAKATIVRIIRRGAGWYLESAGTTDLHPGSTPAERLHLTPDQDAKAIAVLRTQYSLMTPAT